MTEQATPEEMPREQATQTQGRCHVCGEEVAVMDERADGSQVLETHDHALPQDNTGDQGDAERAEAELPREQGTQVQEVQQ